VTGTHHQESTMNSFHQEYMSTSDRQGASMMKGA